MTEFENTTGIPRAPVPRPPRTRPAGSYRGGLGDLVPTRARVLAGGRGPRSPIRRDTLEALSRARTADRYGSPIAKAAWTCPLLALLSLAATAILAVVVENLTTGGRLVAWDSGIQARFPTPIPSAVTTFFEAITWAGNAFVLAGLAAAAGVWFMQRRQLARAALILTGAFVAEASAVALKVALHDLHPHSYAFPSGHTAGAAATYGILFYLATRWRSPAARVAAALMFVGLVTLIAFSRLYLHVHYLSDVLAGTALGVAVAAACLCMYEWWERQRTSTSRRYRSTDPSSSL